VGAAYAPPGPRQPPVVPCPGFARRHAPFPHCYARASAHPADSESSEHRVARRIEQTQSQLAIPLAQWLRQPALDLRARLRLFLAIALIVDRAHRDLVVFGHLSSATILIDVDGTPILRGEVADAVTAPSHHAAPEQGSAHRRARPPINTRWA
jgi:hypothetical protein